MYQHNDPEVVSQWVRNLVRSALRLSSDTKIMVLIDDPQDRSPGPTGLFTEMSYSRGIDLLAQASDLLANVNAETADALTRASHG